MVCAWCCCRAPWKIQLWNLVPFSTMDWKKTALQRASRLKTLFDPDIIGIRSFQSAQVIWMVQFLQPQQTFRFLLELCESADLRAPFAEHIVSPNYEMHSDDCWCIFMTVHEIDTNVCKLLSSENIHGIAASMQPKLRTIPLLGFCTCM